MAEGEVDSRSPETIRRHMREYTDSLMRAYRVPAHLAGGTSMTEADWLSSDDPAAMLEHLRYSTYEEPTYGGTTRQSQHPPLINDRKLRLFALACSKEGPLWAAWAKMVPSAAGFMTAAEGAAYWTGRKVGQYHPLKLTPADKVERSALLRCVIGNPWRSVVHEILGALSTPMVRWPDGRLDTLSTVEQMRLLPVIVRRTWLAWNAGAVPRLAKSIYDARDWHLLPILGDLLEEAGCDNEDVLRHCRWEQRCWNCLGGKFFGGVKMETLTPYTRPCEECHGAGWVSAPHHARGCWVVDLMLGKE